MGLATFTFDVGWGHGRNLKEVEEQQLHMKNDFNKQLMEVFATYPWLCATTHVRYSTEGSVLCVWNRCKQKC